MVQEFVVQRIERVLNSNPRNTALSWLGHEYSYADLFYRVDGILYSLRNKGFGEGSRICIAVGHGPDLVACVLATLKLGATYIPLDARNPIDRLRFIVNDSAAEVLLHDNTTVQIAAGLGVVIINLNEIEYLSDQIEYIDVKGDSLAYILYTSGSTGNPKGVEITHENLLSYAEWACGRYFSASSDRIALYSSLAFDFTVTCIFPPLMSGASIAIYDGIENPMIIQDILKDHQINIIKITPAYLFVLSKLIDGPSSVRRLIVGGEDLKVSLASRIYELLGPNIEIINEYGPTEATVGCVVHKFDPATDQGVSVPIGRPIDRVEAHIVDDDGKLVDSGSGELYIGGPGVAAGYVNLVEQTERSFFYSPSLSNSRLYRTGDVVERLLDGNLTYLGRRDDQVKIRGYRVQLRDVIAAIQAHPLVESAYATAVPEHGTNTLVAVASISNKLSRDELLDSLRQRLPDYMVPTSLEIVTDIPMTNNQKVDRNAVLKIVGRN
ncbi:amino acid adenylation domain-containing protein [Rhizobium rhizogenes]|uniref:amino acid adenylation domain-containing protein n=1 Tax=Rhizobium rhizogenes TaxID=359 RepID=UPI001574927A|nr:amino acid adenylation domain-containing protein [Rhizobium rhizogenes]NTF85446.1 amino acid adenylation domain-containing protein [Rhizobium rhizogenes]